MSRLERVPHNRPLITDEDVTAVQRVLESGWVAPGPEVEELERAFDLFHGTGRSCAVSSGTAALFVALRALGIRAGDSVAVPTYTCSAVAHAVHMTGARPLLCDVDERGNLTAASVARAAEGAAVRAVVAVHTFGNPADVAELVTEGHVVVEDCCQSLGGTDAGRALGLTGAASVFSFYATKIITSGHGGLVHSADPEIAAAVRDFIFFDQRDDYAPRFNLQLSDVQAGLARKQFSRIESIVARRRDIALRYAAALDPAFEVMGGRDFSGRMAYRFVVVFEDSHTRDLARARFESAAIDVIVPIKRSELLHRYLGEPSDGFATSEHLADTALSVPLYPGLSDTDADRICAVLAALRP